MSNQQAIKITPTEATYVELTSKYNNLANKSEGRRMTEDEESKLFKVADTYGARFGVSRKQAIEELESVNNY